MRLQEDLLQQILAVMGRSRHSTRQRVDARSVLVVDRFERVHITCPAARHEIAVLCPACFLRREGHRLALLGLGHRRRYENQPRPGSTPRSSRRSSAKASAGGMIGSHKLALRLPGEWSRPPVDVAMAMLCFAMITAEYVGGKAARDALYLAHLDVTTLPAMVIATSVTSILLVALSGRISTRVAPSRFVPALFAISAVLLVVEWILTYQAPRVAAVVVYLQISGLGPLLGSSFWVIASDCFDPRTAKRRFGQIQGAGTLGGLIGGGIAFEVAAVLGVRAMLPVLALLNLPCAWTVLRL